MSRAMVRGSAWASCVGFGYFAKRREDARAVTGSFVRCDRMVAMRTRKGSPSVEALISCRAVGSSLLAFSIAWAASCIIRCNSGGAGLLTLACNYLASSLTAYGVPAFPLVLAIGVSSMGA